MRIIKNWQMALHDYYLQKQIKTLSRKRLPVDYPQAKSVGILFNASTDVDRKVVQAFGQKLRNEGREVKLLGFLNEKIQQPNFAFTHFSRKELDWLERPKNSEVQTFIKTPFDYLINLYLTLEQPLMYVSALSHAYHKVGPFTEKAHYFDLMIETPEQHNLSFFVKQIEYFLNRLNSDKHEKAIV